MLLFVWKYLCSQSQLRSPARFAMRESFQRPSFAADREQLEIVSQLLSLSFPSISCFSSSLFAFHSLSLSPLPIRSRSGETGSRFEPKEHYVCRWRCRQKTIRAFSPFVFLPPTIEKPLCANVRAFRSSRFPIDRYYIILTLVAFLIYGVYICP